MIWGKILALVTLEERILIRCKLYVVASPNKRFIQIQGHCILADKCKMENITLSLTLFKQLHIVYWAKFKNVEKN